MPIYLYMCMCMCIYVVVGVCLHGYDLVCCYLMAWPPCTLARSKWLWALLCKQSQTLSPFTRIIRPFSVSKKTILGSSRSPEDH